MSNTWSELYYNGSTALNIVTVKSYGLTFDKILKFTNTKLSKFELKENGIVICKQELVKSKNNTNPAFELIIFVVPTISSDFLHKKLNVIKERVYEKYGDNLYRVKLSILVKEINESYKNYFNNWINLVDL